MIGADVVDIERLRDAFERCPELVTRLFTDAETVYCRCKPDPTTSFAGTLAAKEAVMKAAGMGSLPAWARRIEVTRAESGAPWVSVDGACMSDYVVSISHDGGVAFAVVVKRSIQGPAGGVSSRSFPSQPVT
jgi:phosphopantetheine--protein transferase-like protein